MPRAHPVILGLSAIFPLLSACGDEENTCAAECVGTLSVTFADGREEFDLDVQGTGFSVTARCPGEAYEGNVYGLELTCEGPTVQLFLADADYPEELSFLVEGERWDETLSYDTDEVCDSTCESGAITLD